MIVQSSEEGQVPFVIKMSEHTALAGNLARFFGNSRFEPIKPREPMLFVIDNHDIGWRELDERAPADPKTGLPYNLVETPFEEIIKTSSRSPERNSSEHAYCGLISSMHSWGLYNGRYGMSDLVLLDNLASDNKVEASRMLDGEIRRQTELKAKLASDPKTAGWIKKEKLFQNYKQLQFFDTLALYFNCTHEKHRTKTTFLHVPQTKDEDVEVTITPKGNGDYSFAPYPFKQDKIDVEFSGRYLDPAKTTGGEEIGEIIKKTPIEKQTVRLVS
tara:strand:- start:1483 stop:2301 length:819 start_codon:yes stop_codon:yes gene_type:complete